MQSLIGTDPTPCKPCTFASSALIPISSSVRAPASERKSLLKWLAHLDPVNPLKRKVLELVDCLHLFVRTSLGTNIDAVAGQEGKFGGRHASKLCTSALKC